MRAWFRQPSIDPARRQLLRGRIGSDRVALRPPWAVAERDFIQRCSRCDRCIAACPLQRLQRGDGGYPEINFATGGCDFCGDCVAACATAALEPQPEQPVWRLQALIGDRCLAHQGVVCRSCGEVCDQRAIRFQLRVGGAAMAQLDSARCDGCGSCIAPCPTAAITMVARASTNDSLSS